MPKLEETTDWRKFNKILKFPLILLGIMWCLKSIEFFSGSKFTRFGIYPREWDGLIGVLTGPFVHGDWGHLISNSFPLLLILLITRYFFERVSNEVIFLSWLVTGILVWLMARPSYHIGASGVLYSLTGFVLWSGLFKRNSITLVLSLLILAINGGYFAGFEKTEGVSWESHMIGAVVGLVLAFVFKGVKQPTDPEAISRTPSTTSPYFPSDIFEKTKYQRWLEAQNQTNEG